MALSRFSAFEDTAKPSHIPIIVESVSALMLMRVSFTRDTFKPGDAITVVGHANKDGKPAMVLVKFILPDGREMLTSSDSR